MASVIAQLFGNAMGIAISPIPLIALILILFSTRAKTNSLIFAVGWMSGIFLLGLIVSLVGVRAGPGDDATGGAWISTIVGVLFLYLSYGQFKKRPKPGEEAELPAFMAGIDSMSGVGAFTMAILLNLTNLKNIGLVASAGAIIGASDLPSSEVWIVVLIYTIMGSLTILVPILLFFVANDWFTPILNRAKIWLIHNNATVMMVLFLVLGANSLGKGLSVLTA